MRYSLIINGYEFGGYIPEDGIKVSKTPRNEKTVITLDGVKHTKSREKTQLSVELLDMPDSTFTFLKTYLSKNPADVSLTDFYEGQIITSQFYVSNVTYGVKKAYGTISRLSSPSFDLEER